MQMSSFGYGYRHTYNITTDTFDSNTYDFYPTVCKLADNKYLIVRYLDSSATLGYSISATIPSRSTIENGSYSQFIPNVSSVANIPSDSSRQLETFKLDDQHLIIFDKPGIANSSLDNNIYARVVKVIDNNYAYVSDNSNGTTGVVVTSNYSGYYSPMAQFYDGKMIKQVDNQRFYIQTGANSYEFFTLTA